MLQHTRRTPQAAFATPWTLHAPPARHLARHCGQTGARARPKVSCVRRRETPRCITGDTKAVATEGWETEIDNGVEAEVPEAHIVHVTASEAGERLDRVLAARFPGHSRSYFQGLVRSGHVTLCDRAAPKSHRVCAGDTIAVTLLTPERSRPLVPSNGEVRVLYEDASVIVVDKPAGQVVHPAPGNWSGTLVHDLAGRFEDIRRLGGQRPGVVHRLDKGTSGAIVVARTDAAARALAGAFARREVRKEYLAVTVGNPAGERCEARWCDEPIGRSRVDRLRMAVTPTEAGGRAARSLFEVLAVDERRLLHVVRVRIVTGRTHQIRVHARHVRAPVLGDGLYGAGDVNRRLVGERGRVMLHAFRVQFPHPVTGAETVVTAPVPAEMAEMVRRVWGAFDEEKLARAGWGLWAQGG